MKTRIAILTAAVAVAFAGCGEDVEGLLDGGMNSYAVSSGTYAVSDAVAQGSDQCGLLELYTDPTKKIGLTVDSSTVTFNLSNDASATTAMKPTATLNGNNIDLLTEANYTVTTDDQSCTVRIRRSVTGELLGNDAAALTLSFSVQTEAGTCDSETAGVAMLPCNSTYKFNATRE